MYHISPAQSRGIQPCPGHGFSACEKIKPAVNPEQFVTLSCPDPFAFSRFCSNLCSGSLQIHQAVLETFWLLLVAFLLPFLSLCPLLIQSPPLKWPRLLFLPRERGHTEPSVHRALAWAQMGAFLSSCSEGTNDEDLGHGNW